jgi:MSHA biogenesis protein MshQ
VRRCAISSSSVGLAIDEDRDRDPDRNHTTEQAGIFVFEGPFQGSLFATDYYAISHGGSAVTCEAEQITITPRGVDDLPVPASGERIRISANSSDSGWSTSDISWVLDSATGIVLGTGPGYIDFQFANGATQAQFSLSNRSVATIDIDIVDIDNPNVTDRDGEAEDPPLSFADTGFRFYSVSGGTAPIPSPITAGDTNGPLFIRAVETDPETQACSARVSGTQTVSMAYECVNPSSCFRDGDAIVTGVQISANDANNIVDYTELPLTFDSNGEAPFTLQYLDAGQIRLHALLNLPATADEAAFELRGSSAVTTSKPADLFITAIETPSGTANPGTTNTGLGFVAAGASFTVSLEARGSTGLNTPNFSLATSGDLIELTVESLVMPSTGDMPALNNATRFDDQGQGRYQNDSVNWNNVGAIQIRARIEDGDYLGGGDIVGSTSEIVGRFYPQSFSILSSSVENGCAVGNFSYMSDQVASYSPITIQHEIHALTSLGDIATNYSENYPVAEFVYVAEDNNDGAALNSRLAVEAATWEAGEFTLNTTENTAFRRSLSGASETLDGPFASLVIGIEIDASTQLDPSDFTSSARNLNVTTSGDCSISDDCTGVALGSAINVVFGRLFGQNAHGPETASLPITLETQWWNGARFETNNADSCTQIGVADISFDGSSLLSNPSRSVSVGGGTTTGNFDSFTPADSFAMNSGTAGLIFTAPGTGNIGRFDVDIVLSNYPWLRFDWNQNGDHSDDGDLPSIEVSFGSYRGHDRVIYWREVLSN